MGHPTRMVVLRTANLEMLLQELWALRPDLRDKPTATVHCSTVALIRETKNTLAAISPNSSNAESVTSVHQVAEAFEPSPAEEGFEPSPAEEGFENSEAVPSKGPHPDNIWRL
ncbi:MAG: hypothetical protein HLUCCA11_22305 [Phormidesmis priestleyi Ana]|uniref:Uncharacterized protein n=1 Tax=Phormidesmis priestleyi Ana TaxID=1666911 RepID=A0A0P7ZBU1_9CYAN|nr:MAG: hypothetical protein HLUCCA11_22305 [Phormidesmis priestleyi Ana]